MYVCTKEKEEREREKKERESERERETVNTIKCRTDLNNVTFLIVGIWRDTVCKKNVQVKIQ